MQLIRTSENEEVHKAESAAQLSVLRIKKRHRALLL